MVYVPRDMAVVQNEFLKEVNGWDNHRAKKRWRTDTSKCGRCVALKLGNAKCRGNGLVKVALENRETIIVLSHLVGIISWCM
jgi:hypothetical protein